MRRVSRQRAPVDELCDTGMLGFGTRPRMACAASLSQVRCEVRGSTGDVR
jgi:hypothetical protein